MLYLQKFKNLFTLNLRGNPVSKEDDFKLFIAAYFPNMKFLDYRYIDEKTVSINCDEVSLLASSQFQSFFMDPFLFVWKLSPWEFITCHIDSVPIKSCLFYVQKKEASIKYHYVLEKIKRDGLQAQQAAEATQRQEAELQLHRVI